MIDVIYYMGLARYYRRFIEGFSKVSHLITSLQRKGIKFEWTPRCQESFQLLKHLLTSAPVLKIADPKKYFVVCTRMHVVKDFKDFLCKITMWCVMPVNKFEGLWEKLCHSWFRTCNHSTSSQDLEALLNGQKIWVKDIPLWSKIFVWTSNSKC